MVVSSSSNKFEMPTFLIKRNLSSWRDKIRGFGSRWSKRFRTGFRRFRNRFRLIGRINNLVEDIKDASGEKKDKLTKKLLDWLKKLKEDFSAKKWDAFSKKLQENQDLLAIEGVKEILGLNTPAPEAPKLLKRSLSSWKSKLKGFGSNLKKKVGRGYRRFRNRFSRIGRINNLVEDIKNASGEKKDKLIKKLLDWLKKLKANFSEKKWDAFKKKLLKNEDLLAIQGVKEILGINPTKLLKRNLSSFGKKIKNLGSNLKKKLTSSWRRFRNRFSTVGRINNLVDDIKNASGEKKDKLIKKLLNKLKKYKKKYSQRKWDKFNKELQKNEDLLPIDGVKEILGLNTIIIIDIPKKH